MFKRDCMQKSSSRNRLKLIILILFVIVATAFVTTWVLKYYGGINPVVLSPQEQTILDNKLAVIDPSVPDRSESIENRTATTDLTPEKYQENNDNREILLTERELNAMLNQHSELGEILAIDLSNNLASAKLAIPLSPDIPIVGGRTLKLSSGVALNVNETNASIILKGVSIWGIPLPNAWLGGLKNVNLAESFNVEDSAMKTFLEGVSLIEVREDQLRIQLKP